MKFVTYKSVLTMIVSSILIYMLILREELFYFLPPVLIIINTINPLHHFDSRKFFWKSFLDFRTWLSLFVYLLVVGFIMLKFHHYYLMDIIPALFFTCGVTVLFLVIYSLLPLILNKYKFTPDFIHLIFRPLTYFILLTLASLGSFIKSSSEIYLYVAPFFFILWLSFFLYWLALYFDAQRNQKSLLDTIRLLGENEVVRKISYVRKLKLFSILLLVAYSLLVAMIYG